MDSRRDSSPTHAAPAPFGDGLTALAGRYRIRRRLGDGGMAEVYEALDLRHDRLVALKVMRGSATDAATAERFRREVRIAASLVHPNVVPLLDSGHEGEVFWYAMPLLVEGTLARRIAREGRLPIDDAVRIAIEMADGLDHAHRHGLVHRDVKPQNVLLSDGHALVSDFGLARIVESSAGRGPTPSNTRLGTPLYMSPEQAMGHSDVDGRADQYSLACVLYEMLTGRPPFASHEFEALVYEHAGVSPGPVRDRRPETPPHVARAVHRALAKMPEDRFPTLAAFAAALRAEPGASPAAGPESHDADPRPFVGRENELWECAGLLRRSRLLTLTGPAGCGKTRLAERLAERLAPEFPGGRWFVDLSGTVDPAHVAARIDEALGVADGSSAAGAARARVPAGEHAALLVLDDCDHLLAACADQARARAQASPGLRVLATSRERLHVAGEQVYLVPPLAVPAPGAAHDRHALLACDSVRMFLARARRALPGYEPGDGDLDAIARIVRQLDGLPLALELAAARMRMLTAPEILARLGERFRLLTAAPGELPDRHRTLRAALEWSTRTLESGEHELFRRLAVFRGGWTLAAATAICDDDADDIRTLDRLTILAERSLVDGPLPGHEPSRYRLLESVREYATEALEAAGETAAFRDRHGGYFARFAEAAFHGFRGPEQARWLRAQRDEHENLLAALDDCAARPEGGPRGVQTASALYRTWYSQGHLALGRRELSRALAHPGAAEPTAMRARALFSRAGLAELQGDLASAEADLAASHAIHAALDDRTGTARALIGLARLAARRGRFEEARRHNASSLAIWRELEDDASAAYVLCHDANTALRQSDPDAALRRLGEAIPIVRRAGNRSLLASALCDEAIAHLANGDDRGARGALLPALRIVDELGAHETGIEALLACAALALRARDALAAARLIGAADALRDALAVSEDDAIEPVRPARLRAELRRLAADERSREIALEEGRHWTFETGVRRALEWLEQVADAGEPSAPA